MDQGYQNGRYYQGSETTNTVKKYVFDLKKAAGDLKPELFYIGQITGGVDFETDDGLFCEMLPDAGENWELLESNTKSLTYVTHTSYSKPGQMFIWSHPVDLHFSICDLHGWPKAVFKVWRLDSTNKIDIYSYGVCQLPKQAGFHKIYVDTWSPVGDWRYGTLAFYLGNQPQILNQGGQKGTIPYDILNNEPSRQRIYGRSNGRILLEIECITKNLDVLNTTGHDPLDRIKEKKEDESEDN